MESVLEAGYELHTVTMSERCLPYSPCPNGSRRSESTRCAVFAVCTGTHDLTLALETLTALKAQRRGQLVSVPRFDKALDDRSPTESWTVVEQPADVILFEGGV